MIKHSAFIFLIIVLVSCNSSENNNEEMDSFNNSEDTISSEIENPITTNKKELLIDIKQSDFFNDFAMFNIESPETKTDYSGDYFVKINEHSEFKVSLYQQGNKVIGAYCGFNEQKMDCGMPSQGVPNDCSVKGWIEGDTLSISFISCYSGDIGMAKVVKNAHGILWLTTKYPTNKDGLNMYCGTPTKAILKKEVLQETNIKKLSLFVEDEFSLSSSLPIGLNFVFNPISLFESILLKNKVDQLNINDSIYIIEENDVFIFKEIDGLAYKLPFYKVKHEDSIVFVKTTNLAMQFLTDSLKNNILIGMNDSDQLSMKHLINDTLVSEKLMFDKVYKTDDFLTRIDEYFFKINELKKIEFNKLQFFKFNYTYKGSGGFSGNNYYYWNGKEMNKITIQDKYLNQTNIINQDIITSNSKKGYKNAFIIEVTTGDITDESGDYNNIIKHQYFFNFKNGKLNQVLKINAN